MSAYGLTDQGFIAPPLDVVIADFVGALRSAFGFSLPFDSSTIEGVFAGVLGNALVELWEQEQANVAGMDPDAATGFLLRVICSYTGTFAKDAAASTVTETLTGVPGTVVPAGSQVRSLSVVSAPVFATTVDAAIAALDAWVALTVYAVGDRVTNSSKTYACITGGTSAGSGGPSTSVADITDGTAHWRFMGNGTGAVDAPKTTCAVTGPTTGTSGDLTSIVTPFAGWQGAINLVDATVGRNDMTDSELRVLRSQELSAAGNGTADAVRAALLEIEDVTAVTVFVNDTDATNADGMTPHSVEALVTGGDDQTIIDTLWISVPLGIATVSAPSATPVTGTALDSQGFGHAIAFSRPTALDLYVRAFVDVYDGSDPTVAPIVPVYPSDGDDEVAAAIVSYGNVQPVGRDAVSRQLGAQAFTVPGVTDVPEVLVWTAAIDASPSAWLPTHSYSTAAQVTNDGRQYVCTAGGTSASSGGPSTTGTAIVDGGATWRYMGATLVVTSRQRATYATAHTAVVSTPVNP